MKTGDVVKYLATSTVGKVEDIVEKDGVVWYKLDYTGLYYREDSLVPVNESEYKATSFREQVPDKKMSARRSLADLHEMEENVDIDVLDSVGGG